jgi:plasmid stability protein
MANLTVTVDDQVLRRARIRALERGTSVNAVVSDYLANYAGADAAAAALEGFLALAERSQAGSGHAGRSWKRDELYDRTRTR